MDPDKISLLNQHRLTLVQDMRPDDIVDHLLASGTLFDHHENEIMKKHTSKEKNRELLRIIKERGTLAFEKLIDALNGTNQYQLAQMLKSDCAQANDSCSSVKRLPDFSLESACFESLSLIQSDLKLLYKKSFQKVNPFSLPFIFDIEKTWVSLALKKNWSFVSTEGHDADSEILRRRIHFQSDIDEEQTDLQHYKERRMEDHCQLIDEAFKEGNKLLLIEGAAASGKTSLMRRIAYDWATEKLKSYQLVLYAEFRTLKKGEFATIGDLILHDLRKYMPNESKQMLHLINDYKFCEEHRILVLLDGFDEAQERSPCAELSNYFEQRGLKIPLLFHVIITTRPGLLTKYLKRHDILNSATMLGFDAWEQKLAYIEAHFHEMIDSKKKIEEVRQCLNESPSLNKIAETPLFLMFICIVYDKIVDKTVFELYRCIIWWLIDRYQSDHPMLNVPKLLGFETVDDQKENWRIIQDHFLEFPQLQNLGVMAYELHKNNVFSQAHLQKYNIDGIIISVGLLRQEENYVVWRIETKFYFPQRTIQEFFAGGMYYFWSDRKAINHELTGKIFSSNTFHTAEKVREMNELEKFIWRSVFTFDKIILSSLKIFFVKLETLVLDLSLLPTQASSVTNLNKILQQCINVKYVALRLDSLKLSNEVNLPFDFTRMTLLQKLLISQYKSSSYKYYVYSRSFDLPIDNILQNVIFSSIKIGALFFVVTMCQLTAHLDSNSKIVFHKFAVVFCDEEGISYIICPSRTSCTLSSLNLANDSQSLTDKVLKYFLFAEKITIKASSEKNVENDIKIILSCSVRILHLVNFSFSEWNKESPRISFNNLENLESLYFSHCTYKLSAFQSMVDGMSNLKHRIKVLSFYDQSIESIDYRKKFDRILLDWIGDDKFLKLYPAETDNGLCIFEIRRSETIPCETILHPQCEL